MKKSFFLKLSIGLAVIILTITKVEAKTNFVLFIADDCTYWDLGCYGSKDSKTPNIDQLASEGVRFSKCFQAASMCSPTRHNIYTGMYPIKTGAYPNHTFAKKGTKSIVHYMKPHGYRVALAGKRHIAPGEVFDFEYIGDNRKELDFDLVDQFLADCEKKEEPFCLFLCSHEPHTPWVKGNPGKYDPNSVSLPSFWVDTRETREAYCKYLAEIEYMDKQVGKALKLLKKHGLEDETLFVFTSEQGNSFPFAKWTCYNAGLHTGFIVRWPGMAMPNSVSECLIDYSDVVPTFLEVANIPIPQYLDGKSIKDILLQKKSSHKKYSFGLQTTRGINSGSEYYGIRSVTDGQYRYIVNLTPEECFKNAVTEGNSSWWLSWLRQSKVDKEAEKLIYKYQHRPPVELYDDIEDPYNQDNIVNKSGFAKIKKELETALKAWMKECEDKGQETELEAYEHQSAKREKENKTEDK